MSRHEHEREDLLREAVALVERAELRISGWPERVVVGFRRNGAASIYFGGETAYHFNTHGELRRAYDDGLLFKAQDGRLVSLRRQRLREEVQLLRHELTDDEASCFLRSLTMRLGKLSDALRRGGFEVVGQLPADGDVLARMLRWIDSATLPPPLARTPNAG